MFLNFCLRNLFLLFIAEFEIMMFHSSILNISEKEMNKCNLLKICFQFTYPTDFCIIFTMGKSENILI